MTAKVIFLSALSFIALVTVVAPSVRLPRLVEAGIGILGVCAFATAVQLITGAKPTPNATAFLVLVGIGVSMVGVIFSPEAERRSRQRAHDRHSRFKKDE